MPTLGSIPADKELPDALWPVGSIVAYCGTTAPSGWLLCTGIFVPWATTYNALFLAIGHTWNRNAGGTPVDPGDGTFKLPDLRQSLLYGKRDVAPPLPAGAIGQRGGSWNHQHGGTMSHQHTHAAGTLAGSHTHGVSGMRVPAHAHTTHTNYDTYTNTGDRSGYGEIEHSQRTNTEYSTAATLSGQLGSAGGAISGTSNPATPVVRTDTGVSGSANPPYQRFNYIVKY